MRLAIIALVIIPALQAQPPAGRVKTLILTGESDTQYHDWRVFDAILTQSSGAHEQL